MIAIPQRIATRFWLLLACGSLIAIIAAAVRWSLQHPFGVHWDEAIYLNEALIDAQRLRHLMLIKLAGRILIKSAGRPPAYRIVALPVLALVGFHTTTVRLVSLICFALSSWFVFLTTRRFAGPAAGAVAVLIFSLSPVVVSASIWFGTEGPLYLATSAMLYYLVGSWTEPERSRAWIGLGLAIGLGLLSKVSFLAVMVPAVTVWVVAALSRKWEITNLGSLLKATALAAVIAVPWWLLNLKSAVTMTKDARGFVSNSLGSPSLKTTILWLSTVAQSLLGLPVAILVATGVFAWMYKRFSAKVPSFDPSQQATIYVCVCAGLSLPVVQLTGTNHLLRHISPAIIPLAVIIGLLIGKMSWDSSHLGAVFLGLLFVSQLLMILLPVMRPNSYPVDSGFVNATLPWRVLTRREQWDWQPLFSLTRECGVDAPNIEYMGMGPTFNSPQIERPWAAAAASTAATTFPYPTVQLLWRYEEGPLDWNTVMHSAEEADFVLTAPQYFDDSHSPESLSNRYNAEFASRLSSDALFRGPISLEMGTLEHVQVAVFPKKSLACQMPAAASAGTLSATGGNPSP